MIAGLGIELRTMRTECKNFKTGHLRLAASWIFAFAACDLGDGTQNIRRRDRQLDGQGGRPTKPLRPPAKLDMTFGMSTAGSLRLLPSSDFHCDLQTSQHGDIDRVLNPVVGDLRHRLHDAIDRRAGVIRDTRGEVLLLEGDDGLGEGKLVGGAQPAALCGFILLIAQNGTQAVEAGQDGRAVADECRHFRRDQTARKARPMATVFIPATIP